MPRLKVKYIDGLIQDLSRDFKSASVEFGYGRKSGKHNRSGRNNMPARGEINYSDIAYISEWGSPVNVFGNEGNIPSRPFFTFAYDSFNINEGEIKYGMLRNGVLQSEWIVNTLCDNFRYEIKRAIENGGWEANARLTVRLKGRNSPLIETGGLADAAVQQQKVRVWCV